MAEVRVWVLALDGKRTAYRLIGPNGEPAPPPVRRDCRVRRHLIHITQAQWDTIVTLGEGSGDDWFVLPEPLWPTAGGDPNG